MLHGSKILMLKPAGEAKYLLQENIYKLLNYMDKN